jgi:serine/threonine protein kinase
MPLSDPFGFSGALVDGQIQVGDPVGEGGFSVVYRAHHIGLDEPVALKCLKTPQNLGKQMAGGILDRFRAESRIQYRLSQGNLDIVRSISSGTAQAPLTGELIPYIALEWLEGPSLNQELKGRRARGMKGRPMGEVIEVLDPAALALDYAHKQGVVHRDVKPGNLVLARTREGGSRIKVLDFGLAKIIDPEGLGLVATAQTVASVILCSPSYGAPEQFDNSLGPIGSYTDVYSFALIVLEMLRDEKIRSGISVALSAKHALSKTPVSPLALNLPVTPAIDALFQRATNIDRNLRPKDMGEFWSELKGLANAPVASPALGAAGVVASGGPGFPAPMIQNKPVHNVTMPMQRPPGVGSNFGATEIEKPRHGAEGPSSMGTMIMSQRPMTSPAAHTELGPITAPMPAVAQSAAVANPPPPPPAAPPAPAPAPVEPAPLSGFATRISPAQSPPKGASNPPPRAVSNPPPKAASNPPPPVAAAAAAPSKAPAAGPRQRSTFMVAVFVILSFLVFSGLVVTAGYLAHSWFAARNAVSAPR